MRQPALEPWDTRVNTRAGIGDINLLALREHLGRMGRWDPAKPIEDYVSADAALSTFTSPLCGRELLPSVLRPRNFALLLFGHEPQRFYAGAYAILSIYPGLDRSEPTADRLLIPGDVISQSRKLIDALNMQAHDVFDKTAEAPNLLKYPPKALHEAVINALVHRDYESDQPVRVTVFSDRIEIHSPGALPSAVNQDKLLAGRALPNWRNGQLAYFFNKLQLAQGEGQGIPTIFRAMSEAGCPAPIFELESESVTCTLLANPRYAEIRERRARESGSTKRKGRKKPR